MRKKSVSQQRSRRPSEKESGSSSGVTISPAPSYQRSQSLSAIHSVGGAGSGQANADRARKLSLASATGLSRLQGPTAVAPSPPPAKQIRLDHTFLLPQNAFTPVQPGPAGENAQLIEGQQMLIDGSGILSAGHRPARTKKLTEKGLDYHRTISHKNDGPVPPGATGFRVPGFPELNGGELSPGGSISIKTGNAPGITTGSRIETVQTLPASQTVANFNDNGNEIGNVSVSALLKSVPAAPFNRVNLASHD